MTIWTVDPALSLCFRLLLIALLAGSLTHKFRSVSAFAASVEQYELIPRSLVGIAAWLFIACEAVAVVLLLVNATAGAVVVAGLIGVYTVAIIANLLRGRRDIDCGCAGPAARQSLSEWLVLRNVALIAIALLAACPTASRSLGLLDAVTVVAAVAVGSLCYTAFNSLAASHRSSLSI